jgi:hypothetical protein
VDSRKKAFASEIRHFCFEWHEKGTVCSGGAAVDGLHRRKSANAAVQMALQSGNYSFRKLFMSLEDWWHSELKLFVQLETWGCGTNGETQKPVGHSFPFFCS